MLLRSAVVFGELTPKESGADQGYVSHRFPRVLTEMT
ncbi:MAG: hypothetical protein RIR00_1049 [Pseudomonadota bacterium]|jgi:hypothetical protein